MEIPNPIQEVDESRLNCDSEIQNPIQVYQPYWPDGDGDNDVCKSYTSTKTTDPFED